MARMGGRKHLKSHAAPEFWPIPVKERTWAVKPRPGPHPISRAIPLGILIRDVFKYAYTMSEARKILNQGKIMVDGVVRRDYKFPVGLMDVIHVIPENKYYRVVPDPTKFYKLVEISGEEASIKPLRIENKTTVKGGHIQLNLIDGRNVLVRVSDPKNPVEDKYRTLGTLVIRIPQQEILDYIPLETGVYAIIHGGRNVGRRGRVKEIQKGMRRYRSLVTLEGDDGSIIQTSLEYVFVVGRDKPIITLG